MHIRKLSACGWVKISNYSSLGPTKSFCDIAIETDWKNAENYDNNSIQKFITNGKQSIRDLMDTKDHNGFDLKLNSMAESFSYLISSFN